MKDEEMAEEYAKKSYGNDAWTQAHISDTEIDCIRRFIAYGFLAGLKAGRPQWHEPEELPPKEKNAPNTSIYVLDQYGQKVFYSFFYKVWKSKSGFETKVTHWCEIPTFDKE